MGMIAKAVGLSVIVAAIALGAARREEPGSIRVAGNYRQTANPSVAKPVTLVDHSPGMQQKRKKFIEKLMAHGIFTKTEVPGTLPRVWVGLPFYGLKFDEKQQFVSVVYAYYFDGSSERDLLVVHDGYTNKKIGMFTLAGLSLD